MLSNIKDGYVRSLDEGYHLGFKYVIGVNPLGYRVAYVLVDRNHPYFDTDEGYKINCHGGVTFSEVDEELNGRWYGWDYGHAFDAPDPELAEYIYLASLDLFSGWKIYTNEEVLDDIKYVCEQLYGLK